MDIRLEFETSQPALYGGDFRPGAALRRGSIRVPCSPPPRAFNTRGVSIPAAKWQHSIPTLAVTLQSMCGTPSCRDTYPPARCAKVNQPWSVPKGKKAEKGRNYLSRRILKMKCDGFALCINRDIVCGVETSFRPIRAGQIRNPLLSRENFLTTGQATAAFVSATETRPLKFSTNMTARWQDYGR